MAQRPDEHDLPEGPLTDAEAATDDEILEAEAVAEGEPTIDADAILDEDAVGEQRFVDGTRGRSDLLAERDEYLEALQRVKAEFENFKKRTAKERTDLISRASASLADKLLPVLDACDAAISHGSSDIEPIYKTLLDVLEKEGLERMAPEGQTFDPNLHEAVLHEPGEGGESEPIVVDTLRTGYSWKGTVLRPAMVKVRG